jgi:uncharacterized protein YndB with AHSA1/START domain
MSTIAPDIESLSLNITEEVRVRSSITATFAALLEEMGPSNQGQNSTPMPMTLEPWPGGRWFRDLGDNQGHFWGHVQAIKPPALLEITGPMMMSFAVASNLQYRLKEIEGGTVITLRHTALGLFPDGYRDALSQGWSLLFGRLKRRLEKA